MGNMTFSAAHMVLDTFDKKLSGEALKKQFKVILDRLEASYEPAQKTKVSKLDDVKTIVDYLNERAGTKYRETTKKTQTLVAALFKDGYVLSDFQHVIDVKCDEWLGTGFQKHLNPDTLFNASKFEKYVNQTPVKSETVVGQSVPSWSNSDYKNETSAEDLARFERNSQERRKRLEKLKSRSTPTYSRIPDWYDPDYKNSTTDEQQAELDRIKRQALEKMK
ncbi:hypothetical protein RyT2_11590 [Pseudolactococcus yaeyamensis]